MLNSSLENNENGGSFGGALDVYNSTYFALIEGCSFTNNYADNSGGAVRFVETCRPIIRDSRFDRNTARQRGGAIDVSYDANHRCNPDHEVEEMLDWPKGPMFLRSMGYDELPGLLAS